jgi:energy-coupling factor transporter ATP-binding protein EcfA2
MARLEREDEPLVVVLAGGTGAGKSTLANTLAGSVVAATSARRPTTTAPTVIGRPAELDSVLRWGVLAAEAQRAALRTAPLESAPDGLIIVDALDVDSVETANRDTTERLLEVADVWVWLATARTYADEAGMAYLRQAARLDVSTLVVLTQASEAEAAEILPDLMEKLAAVEHQAVEIAHLPTAAIDGERLPDTLAAPVLERIRAMAPPKQRAAHRERTVLGAVRYLPTELDELLEALATEQAAAQRLATAVEARYTDLGGQLLGELRAGEPLRQEVLRRWRELVGSGWLQRQLQAAAGELSRRWRWLYWLPWPGRGSQQVVYETKEQARESIAATLHRVLDGAAAEVESAWQQDRAGRALFARHGQPRTSGRVGRRESAERLMADWERQVAEHVDTIGRSRLRWAKRATTGVNAALTTAVLVLFALSGGLGLTATEVALTAAGSTTTQTVLARLLGEHNVHQLIHDIRNDLQRRVEALAGTEAQAYRALLAAAAPPPEAVAAVRERRDALAERA